MKWIVFKITKTKPTRTTAALNYWKSVHWKKPYLTFPLSFFHPQTFESLKQCLSSSRHIESQDSGIGCLRCHRGKCVRSETRWKPHKTFIGYVHSNKRRWRNSPFYCSSIYCGKTISCTASSSRGWLFLLDFCRFFHEKRNSKMNWNSRFWRIIQLGPAPCRN